MKVKKLVPTLYNENVEMNALLDAEDLEFDCVELKIRNNFDNNFIKTSDSNGLSAFERLYGIVANPDVEDLEFRRQRLWNRLNSTPIFTEKYLQKKLDEILGIDNWRYDIVYNDYTLDIYALSPGKLWLKELEELLKIIMPCNIVWTIHIYNITWQTVLDHTNSWQDLMNMDLTWQEVMEGEWVSE